MNNGAALPNGGMLMVTAPAVAPTVAGQGGTTDPRIWRPKVTKDNPNYKALIRALPRGRDLQAYPYVALMIHRFRDVNTGKRMTVKCCKNIPGVRTCPYCEDVWGRYRAAKEVPGVKKDDLKAFLNQLPEEEWYGNFLIRMDQNHSELANQVKVWPHSKYQHTAFQDPVDNFMKKQADAANPAKANEIQVDTGDAFIPYDPMNGYDYVLEGKWDTEKTFGNGKQGACLSAVQFNRSGYHNLEAGIESVEGSSGYAETADLMISLTANDVLRSMNMFSHYILKSRLGQAMVMFLTRCDFKQMRWFSPTKEEVNAYNMAMADAEPQINSPQRIAGNNKNAPPMQIPAATL